MVGSLWGVFLFLDCEETRQQQSHGIGEHEAEHTTDEIIACHRPTHSQTTVF